MQALPSEQAFVSSTVCTQPAGALRRTDPRHLTSGEGDARVQRERRLPETTMDGNGVALTGTFRGLQVRDSSRELGRLTTVAVVQSIFLVIFADALFAIFFLEIDF